MAGIGFCVAWVTDFSGDLDRGFCGVLLVSWLCGAAGHWLFLGAVVRLGAVGVAWALVVLGAGNGVGVLRFSWAAGALGALAI